LHKKTKILPLPAGKGVGGIGERNKVNVKVGRQPELPPPLPPKKLFTNGKSKWMKR